MTEVKESLGYHECICVTRFLLKLMGVYPEDYGKGNILVRSYTFVYPIIAIFVLIIPQLWKIFTVRGDLNAIIDLLSMGLIIVSICCLKFIMIWYRHADFTKLLLSISNDWDITNEEEQRMMWRNAKLSRFIVTVSACSVISNCNLLASFIIINYQYDLKHLSENETIPRPLVLSSKNFYDDQISPKYELTWFLQFLAIILCSLIYAGYDGLFALITLHYSSQYYNLQRHMENLINTKLSKKCQFLDVLIPIVNKHQHLCRCTNMVENNFNTVFLVQVTSSGIHLCLQAYEFVAILSKKGIEGLPQMIYFVFYVSTSLFSLFIYCWISEQLRMESENLYFSIFKMEWYTLMPRESKMLLIIANRIKNPVSLTAGKFYDLSLEFFCKVLKTCASFFSVLLVMRDKLY